MKRRGIVLVIFFVLLVTTIAGGFWWLRRVTKSVFVSSGTSKQPLTSVKDYIDTRTPFTILLLGYGGGTHDGPYLTDSMMLVHIDPSKKKINLISIPRDIWVKIPTDGDTSSYWKINAAFAIGLDDTGYPNKQPQFKGDDGGGHMAEYMVSEVTGLSIQHFIGMDFSGFVKTIDTLGGVDINVEPAFDDPGYPLEDQATNNCGHSDADIKSFTATASAESDIWAYFPCRYEDLHFDAGLQHMDGARALTYVRSRHSLQDGTDFGRAKRQRNLLLAVKQKVFSIGFIPKAIPFVTSLGNDVMTDLTPSDVATLVQRAGDLNTYQVTTYALTDQNYLKDAISADGQDILLPKDGQDNWANIHNWIASIVSGKPEPLSAIVQVANGTRISGLAQLATNRLKNESLQVVDPMNALQPITKTTITLFSTNINPSDLTVLKTEFGVTSFIQSKTATTSAYNVMVVVGDDYNDKEGKKVLNEP